MEPGRTRRTHRTVVLVVSLVMTLGAGTLAVPGTAGAAGSTSSTTSLASSAPGGSALAQAVTYTATVQPTSGSGAVPTGAVSFTDNGTTISGCAAVALSPSTGSAATAQCTPPAAALSTGAHPIVATYVGDSTYAASTGNLTQTVAIGSTTTSLTSAPASPSPFGVAVTYTATVTAGGGVTAFTPTGTVAFTDGGNGLTGCGASALTTVSSGVARATCAVSAASMTTGSHVIAAVYSSDANFASSTGGLTQSVVTDSTTTVLGAVPASPSGLGIAVTYTATVTAGNGVTTFPTGTITFKDGATTLCAPTLTPTATPGVVNATCTEPGTSMTGGTHAIAATYAGDANFATSTTTLSQVVTPSATATVVTSDGSPSQVGQVVTYTATVTPTSAPFDVTGTVAFKDAGTVIAGCATVTVVPGSGNGTAQCAEPATSMTPGAHAITAVYSGTASYSTSTSATFTQQVNQAPTTTTVASSANPTSGGLSVTYTATIAVTGGSVFAPTGSVAFTDGSTVVCAASTVSASTATCVAPASQQTSGPHPITATYSGDSNFITSSGTLAQQVTAATVNVGIAALPSSPSGLGIPVLYTVTVSAANGSSLAPGGTTPAGSLTVTDTGPDSTVTTLCTLSTPFATGVGTSTWQCASPAAQMTAGTHTITASFTGDSYFAPGSGTATQVVGNHPLGSTTAVSSPNSPSYVGDAVTYTASVNGDSIFAPSGTVAFYSGASLIPGCAAVAPASTSGSGAAYLCTEPGVQMPVGSQSIHAVFSGDANYGGSTSSAITQVVSMGATTTTVADTSGTTDPSLAGIPTSYTATITPSQATAIEPGGTVTFFDDGTPIPGCIATAVTPGATSSSVECTEPSLLLLVGSHLITAVYSGDSNYVASDNIAAPFNQQVTQNSTVTAVAGPGGGPYPAGQPLDFTATVTAGGIGAGNQLTPTGSVTFSDGSGTLCTVPVSALSAGVATAGCTFSSSRFTVTPTDTVTATYNGDTQYQGSSGSVAAPPFVAATPNVTIASSTADHPTQGNASVAGASVTYTATFTDPNGGLVTPSGTVTFSDAFAGSVNPVCTATLTTSIPGTATATCVESTNMLVGDHVITLAYAGDANFTPTTNPSPATWTQHVVADDTTIVLTPPTPANSNTFPTNTLVYSVYTPVTLQATLTSPTGTTPFTANGDGAVTFYLNGVAINPADFPTIPGTVPDCTDMTVPAPPTATISCAGFPMPRGNDTFTVDYLDTTGQAGYASDLGATSYTWQVVSFATNTQISSNPTNPVTGQPVTLTSTVTPSSGAAQLPTGNLTFSVNGTPVTCASPATLDSANPPVATCTLPGGLPGGTDVIQATYPGDPWYAASIGSLSLTVGQAASAISGFAVTTANGSSTPVSGQTLKFTVAAVNPVAPGVGTPTGTVVVTTPSTAKTLCVITLVNGAGSCYDSAIQVPSGTQVPFTATYSGDAGFTSSSATTALNITPERALVSSIAISPTTPTYGQPITYTVTLAPQFPGTVATGTITLTSPQTGSLTLCTITLTTSSDNTGSCTFTPTSTTGFLPTGADQFLASYSGDVNFASGTTGSATAFISKSTVTTAVTVNPQNPVYGQFPSFAVTVTPATAGTTPTGTITILSSQTGLTPLCSYSLSTTLVLGSEVGSCTASQLLVAQNNVTFTAVYSGDPNFRTTTGTTITNVQRATTVTTITPTPTNPAYGQSQTFTVSVAPQISGVVPTGTVTVTTPGVLQPLCTVTLSGATGSCATSLQVPTGSGIVYQASYTGDANFLASTGLSSSNSVIKASTTAALTLSSASSTYGSEGAEVFTTTVSPQAGGTPTGTVTLTTGGTTLCTVSLSAGTGSCSPGAGALPVTGSPYTVTATYGGDANFTGTVAPTKTWSITKATATLSAGVSTSTVIYGNESQASFTATVASPGAGTPTGTVTFKQGATTLCAATLVNGSGSCAPSAAVLTASGTAYTVSATYSGDTNFSAPSAQNVSWTVSKATTSATLTIAPGSVTYGNESAGVLTVTVAPQFAGTPTGTVTLKTGGTTLCSAVLSGGLGTCSISTATQTLLAVGSYTVVASYPGDTNFATSSTFGFMSVTAASTATSLTFSPTSVALGHETTVGFTPTLTPTPAAAGSPTGLVTISATNTASQVVTTVCTVPAASAAGSTPCSSASGALLTTGTYSLTAAYPGDANFTSSTGTAVGTLTITPASASSLTLSLTPSGTSVAYGNESAVSYAVALSAANPTPTGTVTVKTGATILCTAVLTGGTGACAISAPTLLGVSAVNAVVATYGGDANYGGSVSSTTPVNLAVVKAPTTTGFVLSTSVVTYGGESTTSITATVTPGFTFGTATGTVTVRSGGTLCTITLTGASGNAGSCSPSDTALPVSSSPSSVTAVYSGDANFTGSTSSAQTLTVIQATTATSLTEAPTSIVVGQESAASFTPTLTVAPTTAGSPTGQVTITATNTATQAVTTLCSIAAAAASGSASCAPATSTQLTPGTYTLTAAYPGDPNFTPSSGTAPALLTVTQAPAGALTLTLTPSGSSTAYGNESAVTYSVAFGAATPVPTGTVAVTSTVSGTTTTLCTVSLVAGSGSCAIGSPIVLGVSAVNAVVATYAGDVNYTGTVSSSNPVNLAVVKASTTTTVGVVPASVIYGSEHAALITTAVSPAFAGTPTGTVTVSTTVSGSPVALCTITLPATTCTPTDTALPAGTTYDLTAAYAGDGNFAPSSGGDPGALAVTRATTATSLVLSVSTVQYGTSPVFTAIVTPTTSGTATGTVAITAYVSGSPVTLCTITLPATTCTGTGIALATAVSPYSVLAVYSGDGNFTTSTSSSQNLTVTSSATSTIAILSPQSVTYGNEHTAVISATVTHTGAGTPTGVVTVLNAGNAICVITLSAGAGSCSPGDTTFAAGGPYLLTATYSGDSAYLGSTSAPVSLTVIKAATTPSVSASPATVTYGNLSASVLTAAVTPAYAGTPTGTVTFTAGSTLLCSVSLPTLTCTTAPGVQLPVGTTAVTATYSGDGNFTPSAATIPAVVTVTQATSTTSVSVLPSTVSFGNVDAAVFTVTVDPQYPAPATGTVTVSSGATALCTVTLTTSSSDTGTCSTSPLALPVGGPYALTAAYAGDANVAGSSTTTAGVLSVTKAPTATTVTAVQPSSAVYGSEQSVDLTAQVVPTTSGTPTGTVTFTTTVGGVPTVLCTATVAGATASCQLTATGLPASTTAYPIIATYGGDASFNGSTDTVAGALTIDQASTTVTAVSASPDSVTYGNESTVLFSATVDVPASGVPTGTVTFTTTVAGAPVTLCTGGVSPSGAIATCATGDTVLVAAGSPYAVTATYSGDNNFSGSAITEPAALTVTRATTATTLVSVTPASLAYGAAGPVVTVAVAPQYAGTPTGTVSVAAGGATLCTITLPATSCAPAHVLLSPVDSPYSITLDYSGDTNFLPSTQVTPSALAVSTAATTTVITAVTPDTIDFGQESGVAIATSVTPTTSGTPTGTVTITSGPTVLCSVTLPSTTCSPTATALSPGVYQLVATYSGDPNFVGSTSPLAPLTVNPAAPDLSLVPSVNPSLPGRPVTVTATVTPTNGRPAPTGTVRFVDGTTGSVLCAAAPVVTVGPVSTAICVTTLATTPTQTLTATYSGDSNYGPTQASLVQHVQHGYWTVAQDGGVFAFGDAQFYGSMGGKPLNKPIVGIAGTADAGGYWLVASDGGIFAFGDAQFYGSMGNQHLNAPIVGMQPTADGKGYWLVAADGGVFNFGDAAFYGSTGNLHLNAPIVGIVVTADGGGYFLVGSDGGVFTFGDARFVGGGNPNSASPIVGLAATPSGGGYWLAAADGGVYNFGDAGYHGSMINQPLTSAIVGIAATTDGGGYWLVAADGGVFAFGNAIFDGSTGNRPLNSPMVSLADI